MQDMYQWRLHLLDGTKLDEFDATGKDHSFLEADPAQIAVIELHSSLTIMPHVAVQIPTGATPIFKRTRAANATTGGDAYAIATYVGWERDGAKTLLMLMADGSIALTDTDPLG